ncbi:ArgS-related anticodon-binding protein NrtL [Streptomyces sp. SLBN-31]|uniref:ArgS-related anticodon-binding protein NrtL n=1 Tax=Streptomyces sp. SLBN-31 TaxID=2768444 RepID=UPI00115206D0|nr:DALR anticodon-binding domain-containing protein [Streptomyces sp. SLBN-31]TQJ90017.1 arginyl-tRNA synthetase [Streptomyces sp. SLBN-31]
MTPVELSRTVLRAVRRAVDEGELSVPVPARAVVTPPGPGGCGDYATNIALQLARPAGQTPLRVAEILRQYLAGTAGVADVTVTRPGFLNISLSDTAPATFALARQVLAEGMEYGHGDALAGRIVELRIPYDVRAEVVADALTRLVAAQGGRAEVDHREPVNLRPVPAPEDPAPLGPDAARWALLYPAAHDRPRITADHLVQRESNPLFRVRYAHARTRALGRNAASLGFAAEPGDPALGAHPHHAAEPRNPVLGAAAPLLGAHPPHAATPLTPLLTALADHPRVLALAAAHRAPDRLARHLVTVADAVLPFLPAVLPLGEEKPAAAHRARLALAEAAGTVLAGGLSLLGIDAPDHL